MPRVMSLYYHYSNEPSICDAFDSTHVQYINDTLDIIRSVFKPQFTIPNMQNMRFFCCSVYLQYIKTVTDLQLNIAYSI